MALRSPRLLYVLLAGLILLTLAGLGLLGAYFYLTRQPGAAITWVTPLEAVQAQSVAPDMAVLPLAGYADDRVAGAALEAGELETAYATLAYSVLLPDTVRSGHWLLLAGRYTGGDAQRALTCRQVALDEAALGNGLSDLARADTSLQAARGLYALNKQAAARLALAQAENIARYSLNLVPAQRRTLLEQVAATYKMMGDATTAAAILRGLDSASAGPGVQVEPAPPLLAGLHGSVVLPQPVAAALAARQEAALALGAQWLKTAANGRAQLALTLGQALQAEDVARSEFYAGAGALALPDRLALLHDKVAWLTIKYRAARGAYGLSLVPQWEGQVGQIQADLEAAYTELINGYGQRLDTLSPADATVGRVELLRQAMLWARLGLFPGDHEAALSEQLMAASRQLWTRQGGAGLVLIDQSADGRHFYLLSGADAGAQSKSTPAAQ